MRGWRLGFLVWLAPFTAAAAASAGLPPRTAFKFAASAPLFASPGVGKSGAIYVGSGDGYLHALGPDGSFRWSFTVKGRILAAPVEEPASGRVFVVTSEKRLYALEPDSHLRWTFPLPVVPKSELALSPKGTLYFVGQDDYLYGVTTGGALSLRLAATGARSAPVLLASGKPALVLADSLATLKGYGYERTPLLGAFGSAAKLQLGEAGAVFGCEDGHARVVAPSGSLLDVASDCLYPPLAGDGFFVLAEANGKVRVLFADGSVESVSLGAAPLPPVWDAPRRRLVLSAATGVVTVLEL